MRDFDRSAILKVLEQDGGGDRAVRTAATALQAEERSSFSSGETSASLLLRSLSKKLRIAYDAGIEIARGLLYPAPLPRANPRRTTRQ